MQKKIFSILLTLCMVLAMAPTVTFAADEGLKVRNVGPDSTVNVASGNTYEITESGIYRVSNAKTSEATTATIEVNTASEDTVILILDGVTIKAPDDKAAIAINGESNVIIANGKDKDNTLVGGQGNAGNAGNAGILVGPSAAVTVTCENALKNDGTIKEDHMCNDTDCGKLNVTGGNRSAGIGGIDETSTNIITITNCKLDATGRAGGAAIGTGYAGSYTSICIKNSIVKAIGGEQGTDGAGAAIGNASKNANDNITIYNSTVTAIGGQETGLDKHKYAFVDQPEVTGCVYVHETETNPGDKATLVTLTNGKVDPSVYTKNVYVKITPHAHEWELITDEYTDDDGNKIPDKTAKQICTICKSEDGDTIRYIYNNDRVKINKTDVETDTDDNIIKSILDDLTKTQEHTKLNEGSVTINLSVTYPEEGADTGLSVNKWLEQNKNWKSANQLVFSLTRQLKGETSFTAVKNTSHKIKMTITVPEDLKSKKAYKLLGLDAAGNIIEYTDLDNDKDKYTLETDIFGTYVFVYEEEAPAPEPTSTPTTKPNVPVKTTSKKYPTGNNPIPSLFALLIATSSIGALASLSRKKSNKR